MPWLKLPFQLSPRTRFLLRCALFAFATAGVLAVACWWAVPRFFMDDPLQDLAHFTPIRKYYAADGTLLKIERTYDYRWQENIPLDRVSPHFLNAILSVEDTHFYQHAGVDYRAILRAARDNLLGGRVLSGASTIPMQLAYLHQEGKRKNLRDKLHQALRARALCLRHSKGTILQEYVNHIPFGGKLYGIQTASQFYFGKNASDLTLAEATLLAGIPQRPNALRPDRHLAAARKRQRLVLEYMVRNRKLAPEQIESILSAPLAFRDSSLPSFYARYAHSEMEHSLTLARKEANHAFVVQTSLVPRLHSLLLQALQSQTFHLPHVRDGAAVLLDSQTSQVLAMVGTLDFTDPIDGQVNAATAIRVAGSTLKPFLYAEAIDGGLLASDTILNDAPMRYGSYTPQNYDGTFSGRISARMALARSLNAPAVQLLAQLGLERTIERFHHLHLLYGSNANDFQDKGLTLALGTAGHRLLDICGAYAVFPQGGNYQSPSFLAHNAPRSKNYTPGACTMVSQMLRTLPSPNCTLDVAWKTGTSNGLHDAWCIAYTPEYTLGIWFGNKSGRASSALVGAKAAAPVAGQIFMRLYNGRQPPDWHDDTPLLVPQKLCKATGLLADSACQEIYQGTVLRVRHQGLATSLRLGSGSNSCSAGRK